jgi:flagellin
MRSINSNIPAMVATRIYNVQFKMLNQSLTRLSTGLRINTGRDDPAGLIASESLRAEMTAIRAAQYNIVRANNVVSVAESGLNEINRLLTDLEALIDRSASEAALTDDERNANQLEIDTILSSINRLAQSTEFMGRRLLSGILDYTTSGVSTANFSSVAIHGARVPKDGYRTVDVKVTGSAQLARLNFTGSAVAAPVTIEVAGSLGTEVFSFGSGTTISNIRNVVNQYAALTGVSAFVSGTNHLRFTSTQYGSRHFVSVKALSGTFTVSGGDASSTKDYGRDASVTVNGTNAVTDGLRARVQSTALSLSFEMTSTFGTTLGSSTFYVTGGGADFMITPKISLNGLESIGLQSVSTTSLGSASLGFLSSLGSGQANSVASGNFATAQQIVRQAQVQVAELRGRIGAFQKNVLETMSNALDITLENSVAAESAIRDTDFARETSELTRAQILVQSATNTLRLANQQPATILALLQ